MPPLQAALGQQQQLTDVTSWCFIHFEVTKLISSQCTWQVGLWPTSLTLAEHLWW
jgi:hypothetical protein